MGQMLGELQKPQVLCTGRDIGAVKEFMLWVDMGMLFCLLQKIKDTF